MAHVTVSGRTRALAAATLAATLAVAGCSSDSGSEAAPPGAHSVLGDAATAMRKAEGTARGTIVLTTGRSRFTTRWQGDFADGRGAVTGHLPGTGAPELDARWSGGTIYVRRTTSLAQYGNSPLGQLTTVRPDTAIWTTVPANNLVARVFAPLSPPDLVAALATAGTQSVSDGPRVDGVATRKVTVKDHTTLLLNWVAAKNAEVLLDGKDRARRITVTFGREHVRLDVRYSGTAPEVRIPARDELQTKTPPPPEPTGPFLTVRTGTDAGVAWTLQKAPSRNGSDCWRWSSTPPLAVVQPNYLTDTRCLAGMDASDDPADQVDFLLWTDGTQAAAAAVVARFPATITQATLGFAGGRTTTVPVSDGLLAWVGPSAEPLVYVGLATGGTTIDCGVGAVSGPQDLTNDGLVGDPFHSAWSCQSN
jgi:hypothetical protein